MHHVVENININLKASPFHRFLNNLEAAAGPPCGWENIKLGKGWISRLGQFSAGCSPRAVDARAPWAALCIKCHLAWNHSPPTPLLVGTSPATPILHVRACLAWEEKTLKDASMLQDGMTRDQGERLIRREMILVKMEPFENYSTKKLTKKSMVDKIVMKV